MEKLPEDNYKIIKNLSELKDLGMPVMIGTSRKSFIGKITGGEPRTKNGRHGGNSCCGNNEWMSYCPGA